MQADVEREGTNLTSTSRLRNYVSLPNKSLSPLLSKNCTTGLMNQDIDMQTVSRIDQMTRSRIILAMCGAE
jgi:hypothetical protein